MDFQRKMWVQQKELMKEENTKMLGTFLGLGSS